MPSPYGTKVDDGFSTTITFGNAPEISLWEKESNFHGMDSGGPVPTETMRNTTYRTMNAKHLITATPFDIKVAYSTGVLDDIENQLGKNQEFTITMPNGDLIVIWAFLDKFTPDSQKEGEQPTAVARFQPTNYNASGAETAPYVVNTAPNTVYEDLGIGNPPSVFSAGLFNWFDNYERVRLANVPRYRRTRYYFSADGDDSTGDGSKENPWETLAKAQTVISAATSPADLQLSFRRGDVWTGTGVLAITKTHVTVDDYGDPNLDKPTFTRFATKILAADELWTIAGGGPRYTTPLTGTKAWLRRVDAPFTPYVECASSAEVDSTTLSFYHNTGTNTLHVNAGGANPNTIDFEIVRLDSTGWSINKDNVRIQNVILHGMGMHQSNSSGYGLYVEHSNDTLFEECVLVGVEVYYTGYHSIGHIGVVKDDFGESITMIDCKCGYCTDCFTGGVHNATPYVSFSNYGLQELYMNRCEVSSGMLPSKGWGVAAAPNDRKSSHGIYQHTNDASHWATLSIVRATTFPDVPYQVVQTTGLNCPPYVTDEATELRAYIVDERPVADAVAHPVGGGIRDVVLINCAYHYTGTYKPSGITPGYIWNMSTSLDNFDGLAINTKLTIDFANTSTGGGAWGIYSGFGEDINMRLHNCRFDVYGINDAVQYVQIVAWNTATMGPRVKFTNCIITMDAVGGFTQYGGYLGAGARDAEVGANYELSKDGAGRITHNAYYLEQGAANVGGLDPDYLDGDPAPVIAVAPIPDTAPQGGNAMFHAGIANGLEYDFNKNPRNMATPTIGPLE